MTTLTDPQITLIQYAQSFLTYAMNAPTRAGVLLQWSVRASQGWEDAFRDFFEANQSTIAHRLEGHSDVDAKLPGPSLFELRVSFPPAVDYLHGRGILRSVRERIAQILQEQLEKLTMPGIGLEALNELVLAVVKEAHTGADEVRKSFLPEIVDGPSPADDFQKTLNQIQAIRKQVIVRRAENMELAQREFLALGEIRFDESTGPQLVSELNALARDLGCVWMCADPPCKGFFLYRSSRSDIVLREPNSTISTASRWGVFELLPSKPRQKRETERKSRKAPSKKRTERKLSRRKRRPE